MKPVGRPLKVAAYTGGINVPSARFRVRQYSRFMPGFNIDLEEFASHCGQYPPKGVWRRVAWMVAANAEHSLKLVGSRKYDAVIFQRELISTFLTLEPFFGRPRILDVDDAIWLHRRGAFASKLAAQCDAVICGNAYLADYFKRYCESIYVLPTAVDAERFFPEDNLRNYSQIIGWSGTGGNLFELEQIEPALKVVMQRFPKAQLRVICDRPPRLGGLPTDRVEYIPWSPKVEVSVLQDLHIGLMPLQETAWARGKCSFKMLTYMACGVPVVASPVGMNHEILTSRSVGFGPTNMDEWVDALSTLLADPALANRMGCTGREVIETHYSVEVLSTQLAQIVRDVAG